MMLRWACWELFKLVGKVLIEPLYKQYTHKYYKKKYDLLQDKGLCHLKNIIDDICDYYNNLRT